MKRTVVACMRGNKEYSEFYQLAFKLMLETCYKERRNFKEGENLK